MTAKIVQLLERLSEMFPKQDYQTRLEQYLNTKSITSSADVEYWSRQYDKQSDRNFV
jgi:ABC-type Zn uptake system ZnuABC Zn-binding protein ZnuA